MFERVPNIIDDSMVASKYMLVLGYQLNVHGWDAHEDRNSVRCGGVDAQQVGPGYVLVEFVHHDALGPYGKGTQKSVDDTVCVV